MRIRHRGDILAGILYIAAVLLIMWLMWSAYRWFNYTFGYQDYVRAEVTKQLMPYQERMASLEAQVRQLQKDAATLKATSEASPSPNATTSLAPAESPTL